MKKVLTKFLVLGGIGALMLTACKKDGALVTSNGGKAGALTASTTTLVLDKAKLNDTTTVISFAFAKPNYGYSAAVTSTLQIDPAGDNWAKPMSVTLAPKTYSQGYATQVFNNLLLKLNLPSGVASQVNVRIVNTVSNNVAPIYSNVLSLSVTPFNLATFVYVPGNYEGWAFPGTAADSLESPTNNGIYTGVIPFKLVSDGFLIVPVQSWNNKWATVANPGAAGAPITYPIEYVSMGGNNFSSASVPTVDPAVTVTSDYVVLNTVANTLTLTPTLWSVVGDATPGGWPNSTGPQSDTDMAFDNVKQTWSVVVNLTAGGNIKFRVNHDWGVNLGGSGGTLTSGGSNIPIATAGKYLVTLDPIGLTYTVTPD